MANERRDGKMYYQCPYCYEIKSYPRIASAMVLLTTCRACREEIMVMPDPQEKDKYIALSFDPDQIGELTLDKQKYIIAMALGQSPDVNPNIFPESFVRHVQELTERPLISDAEMKGLSDQLDKLDDPEAFKKIFGPTKDTP